MPLITEYDALRFLFSWYRLKGLEPFFMPESQRTAEELIAHLDAHYGSLTERFGYEVHAPESRVNSLGYNFIQRKPEYARALFELNIRNYPQSANVFDSMGDYFIAQQDTLKAIEQFRKAYELGPASSTTAIKAASWPPWNSATAWGPAANSTAAPCALPTWPRVMRNTPPAAGPTPCGWR